MPATGSSLRLYGYYLKKLLNMQSTRVLYFSVTFTFDKFEIRKRKNLTFGRIWVLIRVVGKGSWKEREVGKNEKLESLKLESLKLKSFAEVGKSQSKLERTD